MKLQFNGRVEFDTALRAEVVAVDGAGAETIVADANDMRYHARTWYSGAGAVKTTPRTAIPAGTVKLVVRFAVDAGNPNPYEGYASIADLKLFKMSVPEVRYANPDVSGGGYVEMPVGQSKTYAITVPQAGVYDIMLSSVAAGGEGADSQAAVGFDDGAALTVPLAGAPEGRVTMKRIGTVKLAAGEHQLQLANPSDTATANIDALVLYPVETSLVVATPDGRQTKVVRDSVSGTLFVGTPEQAAARDRIRVESKDEGVREGKKVTVSGKVTDTAGKAVSGRKLTVTVGGRSAKATTSKNGEFKAHVKLPDSIGLGRHRITVTSAAGEGTAWIEVTAKPGDREADGDDDRAGEGE